MRMTWPRARAQAFHDGDGIHALLDVARMAVPTPSAPMISVIRLDQAQERGGAVQPLRDDGMRLAKVGDQGVGEGGFERACASASIPGEPGARRNRKRSEARLPRQDQTGALQALAGDHDARADVEGADHAVRFGGHHAGDAETLPAEANACRRPCRFKRSSTSSETATVSAVSAGRAAPAATSESRRRTDISCGSTAFTDTSIGVGLAGLRFNGRHGHGFGDPGAIDAALRERVQLRGLLLGVGKLEDAQRHVGRHQRAGLASAACRGKRG